MPRDALWVMPNGVTKVVTLDDDGNLIEDEPATVEEQAQAGLDPDTPPDIPRAKRGRRNRR